MTATIPDQQKAFVEAFVADSGSATKAAIAAGYSPVSARQTASRLLATPHVQEAIRREQGKLLRSRLAGKALGVLEKILDDDGAPAGVRLDAAKTVLDRAGHCAIRVPEEGGAEDPPLESMTLGELERIAGRLKAALADARTLPGEATRVSPPLSSGE